VKCMYYRTVYLSTLKVLVRFVALARLFRKRVDVLV
jgi:hypothetical protein